MFKVKFDPRKAAANLRKHRVSFDEAITVFTDPLRATIHDEEHSIDEERFIVLGQSTRGRILFVVYTETDSSVRIIGARLATATERKQYEEVS
ncbi:MAG TPA: BrnT family toxin [Bryocella sp.]|nr:BrnT family toxin [Bryocella sp.]